LCGIGDALNFIEVALQSIAYPKWPAGSASMGIANVKLPLSTTQKGRLPIVNQDDVISSYASY
jgi:hypothetical protein